tara:strand:+ start:924 stop:1274 length:351 start_codon:yes stop_codon:yes gene_type:complete
MENIENKTMWKNFGKCMGKYGEKSYPKYFPNQKIVIILKSYANKSVKNIRIGEGIICDSIVFDGNKPYLVKITKYAIDGYDKYNTNDYYNGMELKKNNHILLSETNIELIHTHDLK